MTENKNRVFSRQLIVRKVRGRNQIVFTQKPKTHPKTKNSPKNQKLNYALAHALAHALARVLTHRTIHWTRRRLTSGKMKNKMCQKNVITTTTTTDATIIPVWTQLIVTLC
jgi:hypothetical protein